MPRPAGGELSYKPGLDGVRALAVALVVAYHLGVERLSGGLLGVGIFFTLSGYLITSILLYTWRRSGGVGLAGFWVRRARRLLPALALVLLAVMAATLATDPSEVRTRAGESLSAIMYVANWSTIASGQPYFERFAGPGPLDHLWSLAVEEQFYLVWPILLLLLLRMLSGNVVAVLKVTAALALGSFVLLAVLYHPGFDNTRAYEGTDTRAGGLLVGAALAMVWRPDWRPRQLVVGARVVLDLSGVLALAMIWWLVTSTDDYSSFVYRGGLLLLSLATAVLVAVAVHPATLTGRVLGVAPLRWVGERSYGIYLWHMPVIAFMPAGELTPTRGLVQVGLTVMLASLSWSLLENPIRMHGFAGAIRRAGRPDLWPVAEGQRVVPLRTRLAGLAMAPVLTLAVLHYLGSGEEMISSESVSAASTSGGGETSTPARKNSSKKSAKKPTRSSANGRPTSCTQVVHVGDSTSVGLVSHSVLPQARDQIPARYRSVGVRDVTTDISGARSIVETYEDNPNAEEAVASRTEEGYDGCWVIAMGTNDTANQVVGGVVSYDDRIDRLMDRIGDHPAMWLTVRTLRDDGPYAEEYMQKWNDALVRACERYPSMRVYDWAAQVKDSWYISDSIHFTSDGYRQRAKRTAKALATAFPAEDEPPNGCLVTP